MNLTYRTNGRLATLISDVRTVFTSTSFLRLSVNAGRFVRLLALKTVHFCGCGSQNFQLSSIQRHVWGAPRSLGLHLLHSTGLPRSKPSKTCPSFFSPQCQAPFLTYAIVCKGTVSFCNGPSKLVSAQIYPEFLDCRALCYQLLRFCVVAYLRIHSWQWPS